MSKQEVINAIQEVKKSGDAGTVVELSVDRYDELLIKEKAYDQMIAVFGIV